MHSALVLSLLHSSLTVLMKSTTVARVTSESWSDSPTCCWTFSVSMQRTRVLLDSSSFLIPISRPYGSSLDTSAES